MNTIRVSNRLDPDQAQHFVGPDLGPIYFQRLSADDELSQEIKSDMKNPCLFFSNSIGYYGL